MPRNRYSLAFFALSLPALAFALQDKTDPKPEQKTTPPASQPADAPDGAGDQFRKPAQAQGMDALLRRQESRPLQPAAANRSDDKREVEVDGLWPDGALLVDRSGRVTRSGDRYEFEFAVDGERAPRRLELLRNQLLELVEDEFENGAVEFAISAVVTRHRGVNYLLLQKVHRRVNNGNLSP